MTTINGGVYKSVTLGNVGYAGPLTITSKGIIQAITPSYDYGQTSLIIPANASNATVVNNGVIYGGIGISSDYGGGPGGNGVSVATAAVISNSGQILGGEGGFGYENIDDGAQNSGGAGGCGIILASGSALENSGAILGGVAGGGYFAATGGVGIIVTASSITSNTGVIHGGNGGGSYFGGHGGDGVAITSGIVVNNAGGRIIGGDGSRGSMYSATGGAGVFLNGGTLINAGTIAGGVNGDSSTAGAVQFGAMAGTLVVEQGAVFDGTVSANGTVADVLALAGTSSAALTGIGDGEFFGFKDISFGSAAAWTIEGNAAGLTAGETIAGFAAGDSIILDGFSETGVSYGSFGVDLSAGGTTEVLDLTGALTGNLLVTNNGINTTIAAKLSETGVKLSAGEEDFVLAGGKATKFTVNAGAGVSVAKGGSLTNTTIANKGEVVVGGGATGLVVKSGGLELVSAGGTASNTVLQGGTLEAVSSGNITGGVTFKGSGGVLELNQTQLPTAKISGFASGDKIELLSAAAASGSVSVAKAGVVTVTAGGKSYTLDIAGAKVGEKDFKFSNHTLTKTGAAMAFQRPDEEVTPSTVPALAQAGGHEVFAGWSPAHAAPTASAIAPGGLVFDLLHVPHGGMQTMAALQGREGGFIPES